MTTAQTSSAHIVHRLIAWLTSRARRSSTVSSFWMCAARSAAALSSRYFQAACAVDDPPQAV